MRHWLLVLLCALPTSLHAQASDLRVEGGKEPATAALALHRGYPAYPAAALRSLGAAVVDGPRGGLAVLFGDTLRFDALSPFFLAAGRAQQWVAPAYREGGALYLPHQFFAEWLPTRYPDRLQYRDGTLRLLESARAEPVGRAPAPARKPAPGSAAESPRVVIIDPGHGGRDLGKPGPNKVNEKDVALSIAKRLAAELRKRGGYEVHLTRTTDTLIALADRPRLANKWKAGRPAALFLSIHANSGPTSARGFETYFLSEARTEDERRVAEMENASVQFEERGPVSTDDLGLILNNLRNDFYLRASNDLAEVIQRRLAPVHPGPNRGVKQAGFYVLVGAFMPAVLVETAFISNRREAALLADATFQRHLSRGLADAVDQFFSTHEHLWAAERTR